MYCGDQSHVGLCLGYVPALAYGSCGVSDQGTTLRASDLHNARATSLNPFTNSHSRDTLRGGLWRHHQHVNTVSKTLGVDVWKLPFKRHLIAHYHDYIRNKIIHVLSRRTVYALNAGLFCWFFLDVSFAIPLHTLLCSSSIFWMASHSRRNVSNNQ